MENGWKITIIESPDTETARSLKLSCPVVTVGRSPLADLPLPGDGRLSRLHAKFAMQDGLILVTDLDSRNGTFYSRAGKWRPVKKEITMPSPAELKFGESTVRVEFGPLSASLTGSVVDSMVIDSRHLETVKARESILVLDLCGSSSLANESGDQLAFHIKSRLFAMCGEVLAKNQPDFQKNTGDGFFAVFPKPDRCLAAAIGILRAIEDRNQGSKNIPIRVRIGAHFGETFIIDKTTGDRHGDDLNIAFRIEGVPGEAFLAKTPVPLPPHQRLVASRAFVEALPDGTKGFIPLGAARLKGIREPQELFLYDFPGS
jgi:class 3 adenylate cyclase